MSDLKWLRDLGEGRTPGPWRAKIQWNVLGSIEPAVISSVVGGTLIGKDDGRFIAAAGTLWGRLVTLAEAAAVEHGKANEPECPICQALVALQAARKEVE